MNEQNTFERTQTPTNPFVETRSNEGVTLANTGSALGEGLDRRLGCHSLLSPNQYERIQTISDDTHQKNQNTPNDNSPGRIRGMYSNGGGKSTVGSIPEENPEDLNDMILEVKNTNNGTN